MDNLPISKSKKISYTGFVILLLIGFVSVVIVLINPYTFGVTYYNSTSNDTWTQYHDLNFSDSSVIVSYIKSPLINNIDRTARFYETMGSINESQANEIAGFSDSAQDAISTYQSNSDKNELNRALFYAQESLFYLRSYPYIKCATDVEETAKGYHPFFFYLSAENKDTVMKISGLKDQLVNSLFYVAYFNEDINKTIRKALRAENFDNTYPDVNRIRCEDFRGYIEKDFNKQKSLLIFRLAGIIAILLLGILIGYFVNKRNIKKLEKKYNRIGEMFHKLWHPKEIKDDTIKSILSINSVTTTLTSFIGIALGVAGLNTWLVIGFVFLIILSLLSSILLGIIALNTGSFRAKTWSYRLFVGGLLFFIGFFLYLLIGGIIGTFLSGIPESVKTYLNNQTVIK